MYVDQHEAISQEEIPSAAPLSIEQLGKEIMARIEAAEQAKEQAADRLRSAGVMLIQAKSRVPDFSAFRRDHCNGLSHSRAYELMKIARGGLEEVRTNTNERKRRHRAKRAAAAASATDTQVRSGTDTKSASVSGCNTSAAAALVEFKVAVNIWFPKMDDAARHAALAYATKWGNATETGSTLNASVRVVASPPVAPRPLGPLHHRT